MALEELKGVKQIGGVNVYHYGIPGEPRSELSSDDFVHINHEENIIEFKIQNGPIKEVGTNGCQIDTLLHAWVATVEKLNERHPSKENSISLRRVKEAIFWQDERTRNRVDRGVEGTSEA